MGVSNMKGYKKSNQDRSGLAITSTTTITVTIRNITTDTTVTIPTTANARCTAFSYLEGDPDLAFLAVYDGHGGTGVANYLKVRDAAI